MPRPPSTIIVVHPKENRAKCSVEPLRDREGFVFWKFPERGTEPLDGYVRLGISGPELTSDDFATGLVVLDGTWRWAADMERAWQDVPVRSLGPWQTAYPRVSKVFDDPAAGLATIEAIYAAYLQMNRPVDGLLDAYYWRDAFLERNRPLIERYGAPQSGEAAAQPG